MKSRRRPPHSDPGPTLLEAAASTGRLAAPEPPLAERLRPERPNELFGQDHILGERGFLAQALRRDRLPSLILWGPPGSGKTTLAQIISRTTQQHFVAFSAVLGGVAEVREIVSQAEERRRYQGQGTIVFVDEIHRFNRGQQDAFLPHVERGTITLIGATTENPSFNVNAAVLSRCKVLRLEPLPESAMQRLLERALEHPAGLKGQFEVAPEVLVAMTKAASGDARRALNLLEVAAQVAASDARSNQASATDHELRRTLIELGHVQAAGDSATLLYDRAGEEHYNVTSALIKSLRGSDPDAAIYWLMRMLEAGDDPRFVLRRLLIFASEDVGNADPRALDVAVNADLSFQRLGMPEGLYPMAQACLYLACCPKSNSAGTAFTRARAAIAEHGALPVPKKLRNAVTALMREQGYGAGYRSAHDHAGHFVPGETYLPEALHGQGFYEPSDQGLEQSIRERLERLRKRS